MIEDQFFQFDLCSFFIIINPSKWDRLSGLSGWTPLRRNSTYGLRMAKSPSSLMSFFSPPYSPPTIVFRSTFPYFLFLLHFLHFPIFPFSPHFPSQNPVEHARSRSLLQRTSFYIPIPCLPMYFLCLLYFLILYSSSFPYFPCLSRTSPPKILLSMPAPGPSSSVLPSLSLYPSLPYFPVLWILPVLRIRCVFLEFHDLFFLLLLW